MMSNIAVTIPPFPSQDLAKLVLGYLAEEQLMTAYDEFLQASPYLDAFRNEYDRIFMTSLKNILAEYRAVKIYVETCKPFILRRKLFQCSNLLEIVKFLVNNVDINKLHVQEGHVEKAGQTRHSLSKSNACDVCISLKLANCVCKTSSQCTSQIEATTLENSVEATSLADLPGNTLYKKKVAKLPENVSSILPSISSSYQSNDDITNPGQTEDHLCSTNNESSNSKENINNNSDPRHIVQDLNNVLNLVSNNRSEKLCKQNDGNNGENGMYKRVCGAGNFQDFSTTVDSPTINRVIVPDSSTSENNVLQTSSTDTESVPDSVNTNKGSTRSQILIRVGHDHKNTSQQLNTTAHSYYTRIASKESYSKPIEDQNSPKITILSNVKVDDRKMPQVLRTATSTPLVKMQTLFINGMPAYKDQQKQNYTQDEIMAMPTIILVPASGASKDTVPTVTQNNMLTHTKCTETVTCSSSQPNQPSQSLEPLVIDVTSPDPPSMQIDNANLDDSVQYIHKQNSEVNHMSLPKDNILTSIKSSTPHVLPPKRKSSSTPRRTSHVRVLDFTTPRRILHETEEEKGDLNEGPTKHNAVLPAAESTVADNNTSDEIKTKVVNNVDSNDDTQKSSTKEKKTTIKLYNWDANLRALAYVSNGNIEKTEFKEKPKSKKPKKRVSPKGADDNITKATKMSSKKVDERKVDTPKSRNTKSSTTKIRKKSFEITESVTETEEKVNISSISVKPNINIISRNKRPDPIETDKTDKNENKSSNTVEQIDTPELEKMSLQNEIGAKLNISDLFETPYKQALLDLQMETPKFLGPDVPDDPLSDIKIMNIPTPRFLNTPKLTQNTPSSYTSRPTDYSSGGSYYKPDDQDYVLATEVLECALSVEKAKTIKESTTVNVESVTVEKVCEGKSRPVRQCTKNVSYNYSGNVVSSKMDVHDDKLDKSSTCSENSVNKSVKLDKAKTPKPDKDNKKERKSEPKKKSKKYKSPKRKETFIKIKPRRTTPVKETSGRGRKRNSDTIQNVYIKPQSKKLMTGKEKSPSFVHDIVPVSTKSRRKSSTPRKLHCTKIFNSESSGIESPVRSNQVSSPNVPLMTNLTVCCNQDSDTEPLRWSDDAPQSSEMKTNEDTLPGNDSDDITKIKEYISKPLPSEIKKTYEGEGSLQIDLIKRGFDVETARKIERDLSGTNIHIEPEHQQTVPHVSQPLLLSTDSDISEAKKLGNITQLDCSSSNKEKTNKDEDETDEFDFSVHESNEDTKNYFSYKFDEATFVKTDQVKLKETFSMEICIEDDVAIRLRAMPFNTNFEQESKDDNEVKCNVKTIERNETPCPLDNLHTPRKAQCYEIFDSTLASLDTPIKSNSPRAEESKTVTKIVLEVEKIETDSKKTDSKKRKRLQSDSSNGTKKVKTDTPYLLNSASIQNIDIESVLSKLHGP